MQKNIQKLYQEKVRSTENNLDNLLKQVGRTENGKPISQSKFLEIVDNIKKKLNLNKQDQVIDLGCGNGDVTIQIAKLVKSVHGYDLTPELIKMAKKHNTLENVTYTTQNITTIDFSRFSNCKIYMTGVLQHFEFKNLRELLQKIKNEIKEFSFLIADTPDENKLFAFYNTNSRKEFFFSKVLEEKKLRLGNWWYPEHIEMICAELDLKVKVLQQDKNISTNHYRFDVLIQSESR